MLSCGLFVCCALQTAALHWVTCQSTLLSLTFRLLAYLLALSCLQSGTRWQFFALFLCIIAAPFSFGGGITVWAEVLLLSLLFHHKDSNRLHSIVALSIAAALLVAFAYLLNKEGIGQTRDQLELPFWQGLWRYTLFGAQFGSLLRSFGLSQLLTLVPNTEFILKDLTLSLLGTGVSLLLLGYYLARRNGGWRHWLLGQLVLCTPFLLTGLGRYDWGGVEYSLSLRYHAVSLLGVCLVLAPLFFSLGKGASSWQRELLTSILLPLLLTVWMYKQLELARHSRFYIDKGLLDRSFAQQVLAWNQILQRRPGEGSYEGIDTEYLGLYPIPYGGSPHHPVAYNWRRHPDKLAELLAGFHSIPR